MDAQPPVHLLLGGLAVPLTFQWTAANKTASEHRTKQAEDGLNAAIHRIYAQDNALYTIEDGRYVYDCTLRVQAGTSMRTLLSTPGASVRTRTCTDQGSSPTACAARARAAAGVWWSFDCI